jgi:hypothetical protein
MFEIYKNAKTSQNFKVVLAVPALLQNEKKIPACASDAEIS